ncbi:histidinol-phosphate transaminase [Kroppenstedtia pulmonis]|uniref:Histidinol-phosphate aminotransferase n=1 Tax=Kroppenstedtia pulmonis TaxID=1380685 RepID=A0A7D3XIW4_9BACL|nr:histidinol-phosphate transaminase [Kroppenstedtia pulmonis]QKG84339.1 histidinol-phosphate transaminase [Kroppenstedtia pulmonis]
MKTKPALKGLPVYEPGKPLEEVKRELGLNEVIKLASNENPYGCSQSVWESLMEERELFNLYPEGEAPELREELAGFLGVDPDRLLFGNGSDEIVQMIARAYLEPGAEAVMADKTFSRYKTQVLIEGSKPVEVPLVDGKHDLEAMARAATERTRIIWVCNPNNPTGTIISRQEWVNFLNRIPEHVLVVLDEAYKEYVTDPDYPDSVHWAKDHPRLIVLRTFSKIYGLASFRIGYGITSPEIVAELNRVREPFNANRLAQRAARAALQDQDFVSHCREQNRRGIEEIQTRLDQWGLSYYPTQGNFILLDTRQPSDTVFHCLLKRGIIVRSGTPLGFPTHIRVTIGKPEQNKRFLDELAKCLHLPRPEKEF